MINNGLEQIRPSLRQLQKKIEQEREANSRMLRVRSDLEQVNRALDKETFLRIRLERQLREKETNLADEQQAILRLEDELREARETCAELERRLENERLLRETTRQDGQTKEDTIREQSQLLQQERELKSGLEERVRDLQIQIEVERNRRIATEREVSEERINFQQDREKLEREREIYQQSIRDSERAVSESEHRRRELQETLGDEQQARLRLEEELRQARDTLSELEERLENELSFRETSRRNLRTMGDTIRRQNHLLQQERELKSGLEERVRDMQIQIEAERNRRIATERELQSAVAAAQEALAEYRRLEPRDWIIRRDEVMLSEKNLGVGAWGNVYEGTFRGCQVAVKQIHDLILSPHNRRLFEREMSIASRCRHPYLLQFIGATNNDDSPLFITELLDTDLRDVLRQRSLLHEEVVCIALDIAKGLNYLHLKKPSPIIHRDISSSNVLLWRRDNCWRAKLSDYGAANFMRQHMTSNPGASIYAAPESQTSQQSPKVDVYSFGVLLCEMCTRELPVPQQIQDQIGLVTNGVLRELIMQCVARAPEARPTMSDVISMLTQQEESLWAEGLITINGRKARA
ncbi:unnamed protein product [Porites lobata]|uniref:Protein kinase domain-containing protein n=1 Tax=Porites lobata TaxID=104759 RepID=A0ABN8SCN1_9CNID|nr:unnamed protein product [Porites lobata]